MSPLEAYLALPAVERAGIVWLDPDSEYPHPEALHRMPPGPLWNLTDNTAPFGSDEGFQAFSDFLDWRSANPAAPLAPVLEAQLKAILAQMQPQPTQITAAAQLAEALRGLPEDDFANGQHLWLAATTAIATALGQIIIEGHPEPEVAALALAAQDVLDELNPMQMEDPDYVTLLEHSTAVRAALGV